MWPASPRSWAWRRSSCGTSRRTDPRRAEREPFGWYNTCCLVPLYTADALILRTYKLAEADRIVVFLTRDRGKKRGVAKGARRARSRFTGALEPLTRAGVAYYERELRDLVRINYVEPQRSPLSAVPRRTPDAPPPGHAATFAE